MTLLLDRQQGLTYAFRREETMSVLESLRNGFGFLLMSFGISSPAKKAKPAAKSIPEAAKIKDTAD